MSLKEKIEGIPALAFPQTVLRGVSQVMLQNSCLAGLLFLIGIFYNSLIFGSAALLGTIASTAAAMALGADPARVRDGLFGFNGALVGIALMYFLQPSALTWGYVVVASISSTVVMAALLRLMDTWKVPALTAPFVFTTLFFILACSRFGHLHTTELLPTAGLPRGATVEGIVTVSTVAEGLFAGVAQVFFQGNVVTGMLFAVGLLLSSRAACAAALLGSLGGLLIAWGMGAAEPAIRSGAFGFNAVLTAIALGSGMFLPGRASAAYATLAVVASTVAFAALSAALEPIGMPALTAPFVLVVWLFLLARPLFQHIQLRANN